MKESTITLNRSILRHLKGILTAFDKWYEENQFDTDYNSPLVGKNIIFMLYKLIGNKLESMGKI